MFKGLYRAQPHDRHTDRMGHLHLLGVLKESLVQQTSETTAALKKGY